MKKRESEREKDASELSATSANDAGLLLSH